MTAKDHLFQRVMARLFCKHASKLIFIRNLHGDEIVALDARSIWKCPDCNELIYKNYTYDPGEVSDGYHTFNELYHHRTILFSVICNIYKDKCWKSLKHFDDTMYDGMFIIGIDTPDGQATYHIDMVYWGLFDVKELSNAPEWDGHTSDDVINRILSLLPNSVRISECNGNITISSASKNQNCCNQCKKRKAMSKKSNNLLNRIFKLFK